jgi:hypothetical protein
MTCCLLFLLLTQGLSPLVCFFDKPMTITNNQEPHARAMLFIHFLGLIMGMRAGFASLFIAASNKDLSPQERPRVHAQAAGPGPYGANRACAPDHFWRISRNTLLVADCQYALLHCQAEPGGSTLHAGIADGPPMEKGFKAWRWGGLPKLGTFALPVGILIVLLRYCNSIERRGSRQHRHATLFGTYRLFNCGPPSVTSVENHRDYW